MKFITRWKTALRMVRRRLEWRRAVRTWNAYRRSRHHIPRPPAEVMVYFADRKVNMYQIRQWYEPLERLSETHPVTIVTRSPTVSLLLKDETSLEISYHHTVAEIEKWLSKQRVGVVLYVNQNTRNFQMMRFGVPAHIFINHGESEKIYMISNQIKTYDYTFVAGQAAVDRIQNNLINAPGDDRLRKVGRPQLDVKPRTLDLKPGQKVVFYAPTWEGDRDSMTYSSVRSHGPELIKQLTSDPTISIIYRPHPRTGIFKPEFGKTSEAIKSRLKQINEEVGETRHIVDDGPEFGWQLRSADVVIADISAVTYDAIATRRPLLLTAPGDDAVSIDSAILREVQYFTPQDATRALDIINDPESDKFCSIDDELLHYYYEGTEPGQAQKLFTDTVDEIWRLREPYLKPVQSETAPVVEETVPVQEGADLINGQDTATDA